MLSFWCIIAGAFALKAERPLSEWVKMGEDFVSSIVRRSPRVDLEKGSSKESQYGHPKDWGKNHAKACDEHNQSPIDITGGVCDIDSQTEMPAFPTLSYEPQKCVSVLNNGYAFQCGRDGTETLTTTLGNVIGYNKKEGPTTYKLVQAHIHWAKTNDTINADGSSSGGSEHTFDGKSYPIEMHMVHFNDKYDDFAAALASGEEDALLVVGVMFAATADADSVASREFTKLTNMITGGRQTSYFDSNYNKAGDSANFGTDTEINMKAFIPSELLEVNPEFGTKHAYATYKGSLTTPPCNPVVTWVVAKTPVTVTLASLNKLREHLYVGDVPVGDARGELISKHGDYRPVQALGDRTLFDTTACDPAEQVAARVSKAALAGAVAETATSPEEVSKLYQDELDSSIQDELLAAKEEAEAAEAARLATN